MKRFFENAHQLFQEIISNLTKSENTIQFNLLHLIEKYQHPIAILNSDLNFLFFNNWFSEFLDLDSEDINALDLRILFDINSSHIDSPINKLKYSSTTLIGNIRPKNTNLESSFELHRTFNSLHKDYYYIITNFDSFSQYINKELRYELLHNSMDIGVGYYTTDGTILSYNAKAADYLGGKPDDFKGKHLIDIFPEEQANEYLIRIKQTIETNSVQYFYDEVKLSKKTLWFKSTYSLVKNDKDQIIGVQIISDDITKQKKAEIINDKFFEQHQALHLIASLDGEIIKTNTAWESKLGYTPKELMNTNFMQLVHPDDKERTIAELKNLGKGNDTLYFENRYKHINGNYIELAWSANTNISEGLVFAMATDISAEKKAQKALKENESKFATFISKTKDGVCIVNQFGEITFVNQSFAQIINLPEEEVIGMYAWDLLFELVAHNDRSIQRKERIKKEVFKLLNTKNDINIPVNYVRIKVGPTNEIKEIVESVFNFNTADGKNLGIFMRDVTDLKLAEIEIKTAYELLKETEKIGKSGSWTFDPITQAGSWSKGAYDIRKLPYDLDPNATLHEKYMHQKDVIRYREIFSKNLQSSKNKFSQYYRLIDSEGNLKHIEANYEIQRDSNGKAIFVTGIDRDITEIIIAHEELQKTKEEYKALSDASFESIFISEKGICIGQNKKAEEMFGYTLEEALGKLGTEWIVPNDRDMVMDKMTQNEIKPYTATALRKDGSTFPCEIQARLLNKNGRNIRYTALKDITQRINAEQALKTSEEKYKALYENAPLSYQSLNVYGEILDVNPQWLNTLGYKKEEVLGKSFANFLHPSQKIIFEKAFPQFKKQGYVKDIRYRMMKKAGEEITVSFEGCVGYTPDGKFKQTYCTFKDITEEAKAKEKVRLTNIEIERSEQKFRNLFENSGDAVVIIENGVITDSNKAFVKMLKYASKEDIIGKTPSEISPLQQQDGMLSSVKEKQIFKRILVKGTHRFEWNHYNKHQQIIPTEILITALDTDHESKLFHAVLRDISSRKKAEKDLIEAKYKAEESDRLKSAFLANMSHEIRTPMNGILGFAELLKEPHLEESEQKQFIEVIERSGKRMLNIINDLIDISKIEANQMEVILSKVDINAQLDDLYEFFTPESEVKKINLCFNAPKLSKKIVVQTDQQKLYAILTNLIKNSVKHTKGGEISFGYQKKQRFLEFYVIDSGTGIPLEKQKNIFERFVQAEQNHSRQYEGAGLGLAITKAYVEMLGGKIWIESSNENGTEIRFTVLLK